MKISHAYDSFEAALKAMRASEIAALGAEATARQAAGNELSRSHESLRSASVHLWSLPARGPSDLVLKARALRWHFPEGVEIDRPARLGADAMMEDAPLGALAVHYIVRDLLALSE